MSIQELAHQRAHCPQILVLLECEKQFKSKITPQKAQKMLNEEGLNLTIDDASEILKFLLDIANLTVRKFVSENKENELDK